MTVFTGEQDKHCYCLTDWKRNLSTAGHTLRLLCCSFELFNLLSTCVCIANSAK